MDPSLAILGMLTLDLIQMPFDAFANRADPDQAALIRAAWSGSTLFAYGNSFDSGQAWQDVGPDRDPNCKTPW